MSHRYLLLLALAAPLSGALAQSVAPPVRAPFAAETPAPDALLRAGLTCHDGRIRAATAHRATTTSVSHERLMNRYDVQFSHLDLAVERTATTIGAGSNVLTVARVVSATRPLDTIGFELHPSLTIDSVLVNGSRVPAARVQRLTTGDVRVRPVTPVAAGSRFSYKVWYHGTPASTGSAAIGDGITSTASQRWGNQVTWTLSESFSAYEWWPSKQVLADKLDSVAVWVTTSADNKVGSNGVLEAITPRPGGKARYEWKTRYPTDYYLVSLAVAQYVDYTIYAKPFGIPRNDSVPVVNYVYNNPQTLATFQADIDDTPRLIENYSLRVGTYPFWQEKYGHSMAPLGGGMEHQTMTTLGSFDFTLTAHELFHQWFGDHVTCRSWQDIWLNESFASYGEYISLEDLHAGSGEKEQWMQDAQRTAMQQPDGSVLLPAADTFDVGRIFDYRLTYKKGATVIHMLRHVLNDDSLFYAALANYQQEFAFGTARTRDLRLSLENTTGRPLDWFFDQWVSGEGYPRLTIAWNQVGNTVILDNTQAPTMPASVPFFRMPLQYRFTFTNGQTQTVRLEQTALTQRWSLTLPAGATINRVEVDPNKWNLFQLTRLWHNTALQPTGLAAAAARPHLTLWPNPTTGTVRISGATTKVEVSDALGRVVRTLPATTEEVRLDLPAGLYLVRAGAATERLVVE